MAVVPFRECAPGCSHVVPDQLWRAIALSVYSNRIARVKLLSGKTTYAQNTENHPVSGKTNHLSPLFFIA